MYYPARADMLSVAQPKTFKIETIFPDIRNAYKEPACYGRVLLFNRVTKSRSVKRIIFCMKK